MYKTSGMTRRSNGFECDCKYFKIFQITKISIAVDAAARPYDYFYKIVLVAYFMIIVHIVIRPAMAGSPKIEIIRILRREQMRKVPSVCCPQGTRTPACPQSEKHELRHT